MARTLIALALCSLGAWAGAAPAPIRCVEPDGLSKHIVALKASEGDPARMARLGKNIQNLVEVHAKLIAVAEAKPRLAICPLPQVNAMVMDGGKHIFVFAGLIERYGHEPAWLAAVLAHELGHVTRRHSDYRRQARDYFVGQAQSAAYAEFYRSGDLGKAKAAGTAALLQNATAFSRRQELDADDVGTLLLDKAGFPPQAMVELMNRMLLDNKDQVATGWLSTHPGWAERLDHVEPRVYDQEADKLAAALEAGGNRVALARKINDWLRQLPDSGTAWSHKAAFLQRVRSIGYVEATERALTRESPALLRSDKELAELWLQLCVGLYKEGNKLESVHCSQLIKDPAQRAEYRRATFGDLLFVHGEAPTTRSPLLTAHTPEGSRLITNDPVVLRTRGLAADPIVSWRPLRPATGPADQPLAER